MKKILAMTLCICIFIPVLFAGFSHAKYVSKDTLSLNLTLGEEKKTAAPGEMLVDGKTFSETLASILKDTFTNVWELKIVFGQFKDYEDALKTGFYVDSKHISQKWSDGTTVAVDGNDDRDIRAFCFGDDVIYVYILTNYVPETEDEKLISINYDGSYMFSGLDKLTVVSGFDILDSSNVLTMKAMFKDCTMLSNFSLSDLTTEKVEDMSEMFSGCSNQNLSLLDLSTFDTSNVKTMNAMFNGCSQIKEIIFGSKFTTENVTDMSYMFYYCEHSLESLDLSGFDMSNVSEFAHMFSGCMSLRKIYVSDSWNLKTDSGIEMFKDCWALAGESGTSYYSSGYYNKSDYAIIDGTEGQPGYLTYKKAPSATTTDLDDDDTVSSSYASKRKPSSDSSDTGDNTDSSDKNSDISGDKTEEETEDTNTSEAPDTASPDTEQPDNNESSDDPQSSDDILQEIQQAPLT